MATIKSYYAWLGPESGYAAIYWQGDNIGMYDWVGLFSSQTQDEHESLTYQWAANCSSFVTNQGMRDNLSVRYYTWVSSTNDTNVVKLKLDQVNEKGELTITPASVLATVSGSYKELMRSRDVDLQREVNAAGEAALKPGCWVETYSFGSVKMRWTAAESQSSDDWVALYTDVHKDNKDYIPGTKHVAKGYSFYDTNQAYTPGVHIRYIKQGSPYVALRRSKPVGMGYFDLENIYDTQEGDGDSVFKIMADQLGKAVKGEPSVFSLNIWPFGDNLLYKNLSYEEVKVIGAELSPSQYYDVIMVYYKTYQMAIKIAEDGERNAKRHAFWQISLFQKFGKDFALKLGAAHEKGRPGTAEDNRVDDLNNAAALKYAEEHPNVDPSEAANTMWSQKLIVGYKKAVAPEHTKDEL